VCTGITIALFRTGVAWTIMSKPVMLRDFIKCICGSKGKEFWFPQILSHASVAQLDRVPVSEAYGHSGVVR